MKLTPVMEKFILHWGEMGSWQGINRTVAQIFALLYLSPKPLNAEEITQTLSVARSNVSTSLRELQSWKLIKTNHVLGDRRDHFETSKDIWELFSTVLEERKRREIDPTLEVLESLVDEVKSEDAYTQERLEQMYDFFQTAASWQTQVKKLSPSMLKKMAKSGVKIQKLLGIA